MADNFNVKQFLAENKLGPYSRLKETEEGYMGTQYDSSEDMAADMVKKGIKENITLDPIKLKALVIALTKHGGNRGDKESYREIAKLLASNQLAKAAETIQYLDTSPNEMVYDMIKDTYPELWDMLFDNDEDDYIALAKPKAGLPEEELKEYEVIYVVRDGKCYRKDDEGNMDEVNMSYCKRFAEGEEKVEEAIDAKSFGGILKSDNPEGDALVLRFLQGIAKKFEYPVSHAAMFVKERIKKLGY